MDGRLWSLIRDRDPVVHWTRLEPGGVGGATPGVPDLVGTRHGTTRFVELKVADGLQTKVQPAQGVWHRLHAQAGGVSYVLVRLPGSAQLPPGLLLVPGPDIASLMGPGAIPAVRRLCGYCAGEARSWRWRLILDAIFASSSQSQELAIRLMEDGAPAPIQEKLRAGRDFLRGLL
jgi:hypothetical protein